MLRRCCGTVFVFPEFLCLVSGLLHDVRLVTRALVAVLEALEDLELESPPRGHRLNARSPVVRTLYKLSIPDISLEDHQQGDNPSTSDQDHQGRPTVVPLRYGPE